MAFYRGRGRYILHAKPFGSDRKVSLYVAVNKLGLVYDVEGRYTKEKPSIHIQALATKKLT